MKNTEENEEKVQMIIKQIGIGRDEIFVCKECGNPDIEEKVWTKVNGYSTGTAEEGTVYCDVCEANTECMYLPEYEELEDLGDI